MTSFKLHVDTDTFDTLYTASLLTNVSRAWPATLLLVSNSCGPADVTSKYHAPKLTQRHLRLACRNSLKCFVLNCGTYSGFELSDMVGRQWCAYCLHGIYYFCL